MQEFLEHCCKGRHYFFSIKKCGESTCTICRPLRCSPEDFEQLHYLPDPVPGEDMHLKICMAHKQQKIIDLRLRMQNQRAK